MDGEVQVAIVGAGAAGIAAARRLRDRGRGVLVIEAMARVGGRAHSVQAAGMTLDLGCSWLHSAERNPLAGVAEAEGFSIDRSPAAWRKQLRNLGFAAAEQREAEAAYDALEAQLRRAPPADDVAGSRLARDHPWRGYLDMMSGAINGVELDRLSAADVLAYEEHASDENWRLPSGYGTLIAQLAQGVPTARGTSVTAIDHHGTRVSLETTRGRIDADAVIVAVPTDVIARGDIAFAPGVTDHLHAAASLPLGRDDKLFLAVADAQAIPPETHLIGNPRTAETGSYYLRPLGLPVIECFFGGIIARRLAEEGDAARTAFAIGELGALLGQDFARGLTPLIGSWWHKEPSIGGAYSHALPGRADQRAVLARPVSERMLFAGEACSAHDFSTAHGAWVSGIAAADWIEQALAA